jgi:hypothetical protein
MKSGWAIGLSLLLIAGCEAKPSIEQQPQPAPQTSALGVAPTCAELRVVISAAIRKSAPPARDTAIADPGSHAGWPRTGCQIAVTDTANRPAILSPFDAVETWFQQQAWIPALPYSADGPDGTLFGFANERVLCITQGQWDGGDDGDSTHVPAPGYSLTLSCVPLLASDTSRTQP